MGRTDFLTGPEEQFCEWCLKIAGVYNRRENLIKDGYIELGMKLDIHIKKLISDFLLWNEKQGRPPMQESDPWREL